MPLGKRTNTKRSQKGENKTAKEISGRRQPGSGNQWHSKADIKSEEYLVERKDTDTKGYRLTRKELEQLRKQAAEEDLTPVFLIAFGDREYAIIDWDLFLDLQSSD